MDADRVVRRVDGRNQAQPLIANLEQAAYCLHPDGRESFWDAIQAACDWARGSVGSAIRPKGTVASPQHHSPDIKEAEETTLRLLDLVEDLPEEAMDYGESVAEKTRAIIATIRKSGRVTDTQRDAFKNMEDCLRTWLPGD